MSKKNRDIVYIKDLQIKTIIGIYDWERKIKQTVSIDIEMATNIAKAAASENIEDTINYKAVGKRIIQFVEDSSYQLVETMAEKVAQIILDEFAVPWLRLRISKPGALRSSKDVGLVIERERK
ncbi:MAG: dihydroneopterin aldolase [Gammaproteobacteria bacterium]|nr:dihydroneopterin aldolase [Gammaproteobacteria bacterium]